MKTGAYETETSCLMIDDLCRHEKRYQGVGFEIYH